MFSNWGSVAVDIAAPGTQTLSTYSTTAIAAEDFEAQSLFSGWVADGWVGDSGGLTNDTATQSDGSTRTAVGPEFAVEGPSRCTVSYFRQLTSSDDDAFEYGLVVNSSCTGRRAVTSPQAGTRRRSTSRRGLSRRPPALHSPKAPELPPRTGYGSTTSGSRASSSPARKTRPVTNSHRERRWPRPT